MDASEGISALDGVLSYLTYPIWMPNTRIKLNIVRAEPLIFSVKSIPSISVYITITFPVIQVKTDLPS